MPLSAPSSSLYILQPCTALADRPPPPRPHRLQSPPPRPPPPSPKTTCSASRRRTRWGPGCCSAAAAEGCALRPSSTPHASTGARSARFLSPCCAQPAQGPGGLLLTQLSRLVSSPRSTAATAPSATATTGRRRRRRRTCCARTPPRSPPACCTSWRRCSWRQGGRGGRCWCCRCGTAGWKGRRAGFFTAMDGPCASACARTPQRGPGAPAPSHSPHLFCLSNPIAPAGGLPPRQVLFNRPRVPE